MERYAYVKVLLYAYPKMGELAEAVSEGADAKAFLSFRSTLDALTLAEKIADEIATAQKLRLWQAELEAVFSGLGEEELYLLEYKYFRRKKELAGRFSGALLTCSERSYFRMQNALLGKIAARLIARGGTERNFFRAFGGFAPFMRVFRAIAEGREQAVVFKRRRRALALGQRAAQNSNPSSAGGAGFLRRSSSAAATSTAAPTPQTRATVTGDAFSSPGGSVSPGGASAGPAASK